MRSDRAPIQSRSRVYEALKIIRSVKGYRAATMEAFKVKSPPNQVPPVEHKGLKSEDLGNIIGRRGAGLTTVGGGDQLMHSLSWYGKDAPPMVTDMMNPPSGPTVWPRGRMRGFR